MEKKSLDPAGNLIGQSNTDNSKEVFVESGDVNSRISLLTDALSKAANHIEKTQYESYLAMGLIIVFCIADFIFIICLGYRLFDVEISNDWTITKAILTSLRNIVVVGALYYVSSFLLNLLKSYIHIYQRNSHRLMVINSMASLVESASREERDKIYHKLLDIIICLDKNGILKEDDKKSVSEENEIIIELIKKIPVPKF